MRGNKAVNVNLELCEKLNLLNGCVTLGGNNCNQAFHDDCVSRRCGGTLA